MLMLDAFISNTINSLGDGLDLLMKSLSIIGQDTTYFFSIIILIWCVDYHRFSKLSLIVPFSGLMAESLKLLIHMQRPWHIIEGVKQLDSFGMPSGHALSAAAFWTYIANLIEKRFMWVVSIVMIVGIGISRIYRESHFPSQVLVGFLLGILLIVGFIKLEKSFRERFFNLKKNLLISIMITLPMVFVLIAAVSYIVYNDGNGIENLSSSFQLSGLFIGFAIGLINIRKHGKLDMKVVWWKQLMKLAVCGASCTLYSLVLEYSSKLTDIIWIEGLISVSISVFAGMWFVYYAPVLFKKLLLCKSAN